jgi:non-specific serine/threonine protein kinase
MHLRAAVLGGLAFVGAPWQTHAPLPVPRTEVAATAFGGEVVVAGGFLEDGSSSRRVDVFDPDRDEWRRDPDLPAGVNHAAAAVSRNRLYVLGGYGAARSAFVLVDGRWRTLHLPGARAAAGAAALRGTIYVVGGVAARGLARSMLAYGVADGEWRTLPGPRPRQHLAVTAARGRIYAIGGRSSGAGTNMAVVESWAPGERRWRREPPLPEPRGGTGAAAVGSTIVSVGGEAPSGTLGAVYAYDVGRRRWRRLPDLPTPRHGLGVAAVGGTVYAIGGGPQPGLHVSDANESLRLSGRRR